MVMCCEHRVHTQPSTGTSHDEWYLECHVWFLLLPLTVMCSEHRVLHTQPSTDTSHDNGPEAKPGCWCIGSSGGDAGEPERARSTMAMAKPTDPERTAGVSASVAVALAVSGDGAGGRERGRSQRRHPSPTIATTGQHCNKRTMERIVSPPKRMHRTKQHMAI